MLGRRIGGEEALPVHDGQVIWPFAQMARHAVIFGNPGSGRAETAMRIAHEVAAKTDAAVFFVDAGDDPQGAERFAAVMADAGRRLRSFPDQPFDAWRDPQTMVSRLLSLAGPWHDREGEMPEAERTLANVMLQTVCRGSMPRSSADLIAGLRYDALLRLDTDMFRRVDREALDRVALRFRALFEQLEGALDGEWSWEDADAAYIGVELARDPGSRGLTDFLLDDWVSYLRHRRQPGRRCLMLVSGLTPRVVSGERLEWILGQASMFEAGVVLSWDAPADIGPKDDRKRVIYAVWTKIIHATGSPDNLCALAGSERASEIDTSYVLRGGEWRPQQTIHQRDRPKVTPGDLATLPPGTAWIIEKGKAIKVEMAQPGGRSAAASIVEV